VDHHVLEGGQFFGYADYRRDYPGSEGLKHMDYGHIITIYNR
jgi:hypothetical protein